MFSREFYEIVHIIGIALTFAAMGGLAMHAAEGGTKKGPRARRVIMVAHGIGMFLILLGGFGMLARLGLTGGMRAFPGWLWGKIAVWLLIGGLSGLPYRAPKYAAHAMLLIPLLAGVAAYLALYKPF